MNPLQSLACPNCGSPLPEGAVPGSLVRCPACGSTFNLPVSLTPEPELGSLLLGADFNGPDIPGWHVYAWETPATFENFEGIPEWRVTLAPEPNHLTDFLLNTPGPLDDFDVCVSLRFLKGDEKDFFAGLDLRVSEDGYYSVVIDNTQHFRVAWFDKKVWGGYLVEWTVHPSLRAGMEQRNTLRVSLHNTQMRIYLNGVLATSLHDGRFSNGKIRLIAASYDQEMIVAASNLQVREVKPA